MFFRRCFSGDAFPAILFRRYFSGDTFPSSLSHLGKPRLFTTCLNTMTTNSPNNIIRGLFRRIQERLVFPGAFGPHLSSLSHLGKPRLFTECLNTMTTNRSNNIIRGLFRRIQERLVGGPSAPFVQPLIFRKLKTLYNMFEHDDTCVHLGMFREVFFGDAFSAMLFHTASHI